ncbi:hypothetical protein [Streptomyces canus]|uniref:hypothetical protein n=1 Tax=Streptomyces canus TaxID=58343 RepID=UPI0030E3B042
MSAERVTAAGGTSRTDMEATVFEHRTEAEMRLYSEKMARELALKRRQKESDVKNDDSTENDDVVDTSPRADEAPATTVTTDPE